VGTVKTVLRGVALLGLVLAAAWVIADPRKFDAWVASAAALVVFLGLLVPTKKDARSQEQRVSGGSTGIQVGGDVTVNEKRKR
jgi:hypothetical protein